jgi:hypothetical protein
MSLLCARISWFLPLILGSAMAQAPAPAPFPTVSANAPVQPPAAQLVVGGQAVYVLRGDVLWALDPVTLELRGRFDFLATEKKSLAVTPPAKPEPPAILNQQWTRVNEGVQAATRHVGAAPMPASVAKALQWLRRYQDEDGRYDAANFQKHDLQGPRCEGAGSPMHDIGVTALAVLAFLGDGSTMRSGPYKDEIKKACFWLRGQQQPNGRFGSDASHDFIYDHAIATLAMAEAFGLSQYGQMKVTAQQGIAYLESHRNPYAVWRYMPRDSDNDSSVTAWASLALSAGEYFALAVDPLAKASVATWFDSVTDADGRVGYSKLGERAARRSGEHAQRFPTQRSETMTAAALAARLFLGQTTSSHPNLAKSAAILAESPPTWLPDRIDPIYFYFGTLALSQIGGDPWTKWSTQLDEIESKQRNDGPCAGSWDPIGVWDYAAGRVGATALVTLALQIRHRHRSRPM